MGKLQEECLNREVFADLEEAMNYAASGFCSSRIDLIFSPRAPLFAAALPASTDICTFMNIRMMGLLSLGRRMFPRPAPTPVHSRPNSP